MALIRIEDEIQSARRYFLKEAEKRGVFANSRLYTIMDHGGGWRFVVALSGSIKHHLTKGERAIKVPKVRIAEPVEWDDIPRTIKLAERYASHFLGKDNPCGNCKACCRILLINDEKLKKPAFAPCVNLDSCVNGCGIYPARPKTCKAYECEWLKSQQVNDKMPLELRPDNCGVIFQTATAAQNYDPDVIEAHPDPEWPSNPLDAEKVRQHISSLEQYGKRIVVITNYVIEE